MSHSQNSAKRAAESAFDPGAQQIAMVYAKAFLDAASKQGKAETVASELDSFLDDVLAKLPEFASVLASSLVGEEEKSALLDKCLLGKASELFSNFLKVLARHDRLAYLMDIRRVFHVLLDESLDRRQVEVITAAPLDANGRQAISRKARELFGGEPKLNEIVDPSLIGGLVMRVGDTVYDGSVATRLSQVRANMIDRSIHEIQRRRDRFGNPGGN